MNVLIDPGHGGPDPGACANGMREADYTLSAGMLLMQCLISLGHQAHMTRAADHALAETKAGDLAERCAMEHRWRPDLYVSLHCNAAESELAYGFEVWTSLGETRSDLAAEKVINEFHKAFPARMIRRDWTDGDQDKERTPAQKDLFVLVETKGPAVLVEMGFLTNADEAAWMRNNQPAIVRALAAGIVAFGEAA